MLALISSNLTIIDINVIRRISCGEINFKKDNLTDKKS